MRFIPITVPCLACLMILLCINISSINNGCSLVPVPSKENAHLLSMPYAFSLWEQPAAAQGTLGQEQGEEKIELEKMRNELSDVKSTVNEAVESLNELGNQISREKDVKEIHLFARESGWEVNPEAHLTCLTYNGKVPGPTMRVNEGEMLRVVLHNQMKVSTSLYFHGLLLPHNVNGLPRQGAGIVRPGETYAYQFVPKQQGTFWYHPHVIHADQKKRGLYGAIVVEPKSAERQQQYDKDLVLLLGNFSIPKTIPVAGQFGKTSSQDHSNKAVTDLPVARAARANAAPYVVICYVVNGKTAPLIPNIELRKGERVLIRLINASDYAVPLHLSGHKLKVVSINGGDPLEPDVLRDTLSVNPSDRVDIELKADNPGVWSLASELPEQSTNSGKFPGGIALVVRYVETKGPSED